MNSPHSVHAVWWGHTDQCKRSSTVDLGRKGGILLSDFIEVWYLFIAVGYRVLACDLAELGAQSSVEIVLKRSEDSCGS